MTIIAREELEAVLSRLPRAKLAHLPTPLDYCERLSKRLNGPRIWIKRDDCTGLAFGGNKARQHEFILGDALARGVDVVIQGAASQSNQSRQLAAAAARLGIDCILMPRRDKLFETCQGNQLVASLFGAKIVPVDASSSLKEAKEQMAQSLRAAGRTPAILGMGAEAALTLAAVAYIAAYIEILDQLAIAGEEMASHIYVTSQGSTQAGLLAASKLLGQTTIIEGINPMDARNEAYEGRVAIAAQCAGAARLLGFDLHVDEADIRNSTDWVGPDYGLPAPAAQRAARLLAETEGMLLDPVYSSKGFSGLVGDIEAGKLGAEDRVVFIHTGGLPAIFSHKDASLGGASFRQPG